MQRPLLAAGLVAAATLPVLPVVAAGPAEAAAPVAEARLATPVLSVRRIPGLIASEVAVQRLATKVSATMAVPSVAAGLAGACAQVDVGGRTVYVLRPTEAKAPASNMKILTAFVALDRLGADTRLSTDVVAASAPKGGKVNGPLFLVGGGDPLLETDAYADALVNDGDHRDVHTRLVDLADAVAKAGITSVAGGIVADDSRFDTQRAIPTWEPNYQPDGEVGPLGALMVNDGMTVLPPGHALAPDPATHAAGLLADLLRARGIDVQGGVSRGTAPAKPAAVASLPSLTVAEMVGEMLRQSDNTTAEVLLKELGHRFGGAGSSAAGAAVVHDTLASKGLPIDGLVINDGSGLDRHDAVSCTLMAAVLEAGGRDGPLAAGLAEPGKPGTLSKRMLGTAAVGRVHAKTGTLRQISALSGWVDPPAGATGLPPVVFTLLMNRLPASANGPALGDRLAVALASWPDVPAVASLGPKPPT